MARYAPLDDGSYAVEFQGRPLRTAIDPVEYGYESGYEMPAGPTSEERLAKVAESVDLMRRENDPDYRAFAEQQDREREFVEQEQRTRQLGERIQQERQEAPPELQPTAQVTFDSAEKAGRFSDDTRQVSDAGGLPASPPTGKAPLVRFAPAASATQSQGAPATGKPRDPTKQALSDYAAQNLVRRTGPTKGGWQPTSVTTQREGVPTLEALANVEKTARETDAAGDEQVLARAEALDKKLQPVISGLESSARSLQASYRERKRTDEELARLKTVSEQKEKKAEDMTRINARDDYWASKGAFAKVLAAISIGAFQVGQGMSGMSGPNIPLELTEAAIEENAERLRLEHEDAIAGGKSARNAYSEALATYGTKEDAMKALRLEGQALTDRMQGIQLQRYGTDQERADFEMQKAQRKEQRAMMYAELSAKAAGSTVSAERYVPGSSGGSGLDPKMVDLYLKLNPDEKTEGTVSQLRASTESRVRLPPKLAQAVGADFGYAKDATQAKDAEVAMQRGESGLDAISRMRAILGPSGRPLVPEDRAAAQAAMTEIQTHLASPFFLQQQTGEELKLTGKLTGEQAIDLFTLGTVGQGIKALDAAERAFKRTVNAYERTLTKSYGGDDVIVPNYDKKVERR